MTAEDNPSTQTRVRRFSMTLAIIALLLLLFVAMVIIQPAMPDRVLLFTGPESSAYHEFGLRLATELESRGLEAEVVTTGGSLENLKRLADIEDAVALAPSIVNWNGQLADSPPLVALGSVAVEPLWLFYRHDLQVEDFRDLSGMNLASAGEDSTSYLVAKLLIDQTGLTDDLRLVPLASSTAAKTIEGFESGSIDAVFLAGKANSSVVKSLLEYDGASLLSFRRGTAFAMRVPGATVVVAPEGVFDMARNFPPKNTELVACATCLIAREDVHPAVIRTVLAAAEALPQESVSFVTADEFPSSQHVTLPLAPAAQRYFRQGEVGLAKFLPYRAVRFLNHLGLFVLPLLTVALVLLKAVPTGLRMLGATRIKRAFRQLESIEKAWATGADPEALVEELDQMDKSSATMFVPRSITHDYVDFRQFLHDMRERIRGEDRSGN